MRVLCMLLMLVPLQSHAAEWAHCYLREAPEDAKLSTASPPPMEAFSTYLGVAVIRHACGADTSVDRSLMSKELETAGCSETSEIANYAGELMSAVPEELAAQYSQQLKMDTDGFDAFCASLAPCEPTEDEAYDQACFDALEKAVGG